MEGFHPADIIIHLLNIVVLFVLLRLILWRTVLNFLKAREDRVAGELEAAENAQKEAEDLKVEYEQNLETLEAKGRDIMRDSQIQAAEESQEIIKEARTQADEILSEAHERIENEKTQAVVKARYEIAQLATDMAARILKREVSADDNKAVVEDFFRETR
jgi:F-type H+-transporting ATPase subunit b